MPGKLPPREHYAQPRGFIWVDCPLGRCKYKHRFAETDLTLQDPLTTERRETYLRQHHVAGHPKPRGASG